MAIVFDLKRHSNGQLCDTKPRNVAIETVMPMTIDGDSAWIGKITISYLTHRCEEATSIQIENQPAEGGRKWN